MVEITRTRDGRPAVWESGGGSTNTGQSVVVASPPGDAKPAAYVNRRGHLACGQHALIPVRAGDVVVEADHHRGDFEIRIWTIVANDDGSLEALDRPTLEMRQGVWTLPDNPLAADYDPRGIPTTGPGPWGAAVQAAKAKALCYHCREPHFIASLADAEAHGGPDADIFDR
ncbi:MAG: hypothetical protein KGK07_14445 [Chloroflexota bacterium]|nr:hypothetical protein [Chloroflexota bacterium]